VHCHARYDNQDVFFAEAGDCLTEAVVLVWVFCIEERDLDDWDIERVCLWLEG
jgi:hypothetical protein